MKHTPGPWITKTTEQKRTYPKGNIEIISTDDKYCGEVAILYSENWGPNGMDKANASLIAAAPELLEALSSLLNFSFTSKYDNLIDSGCEENVAGHTVSAKLHEIHKRGREAIAKAEGTNG